MKIEFKKYQGTGNDFIMLDNLDGKYESLSIEKIQFLCDRKLGIGADGLIKISSHPELDFEVEYFNADGSQSFCGNGARCSVSFSKELGIINYSASFIAIDGIHKAMIADDGIVKIDMLPVKELTEFDGDYFLDTGSPHYVRFLSNDAQVDIVTFGKEIRYSEKYERDGVNVNTVKVLAPSKLRVETYERGVEDETLSCGTGVTACALAYKKNVLNSDESIIIETKGGQLEVYSSAYKPEVGFENIWLAGPAKKVYDGSINV